MVEKTGGASTLGALIPARIFAQTREHTTYEYSKAEAPKAPASAKRSRIHSISISGDLRTAIRDDFRFSIPPWLQVAWASFAATICKDGVRFDQNGDRFTCTRLIWLVVGGELVAVVDGLDVGCFGVMVRSLWMERG